MNKLMLFLLAIFSFGIIQAQGQGPEMQMIGPTLTAGTSLQTCYDITFIYKCPEGMCKLKVYSDYETPPVYYSGPPNMGWKTYTANLCYKNKEIRSKDKAYCEVNGKFQSVDDGCVVVVEGGG